MVVTGAVVVVSAGVVVVFTGVVVVSGTVVVVSATVVVVARALVVVSADVVGIQSSEKLHEIITLDFLSGSAMLESDIAISGMTVCLYICLPHASIDSKLITVSAFGMRFAPSDSRGNIVFL